jgi:hypothetical protein
MSRPELDQVDRDESANGDAVTDLTAVNHVATDVFVT